MLAEAIGFCVKLPVTRIGDARAITLVKASFAAGSLRVTSYARPGKLFTANRDLMVAQVGILKAVPFGQIIKAVLDILHASLASTQPARG